MYSYPSSTPRIIYKTENPGPWGNSPEAIASWFGPDTTLKKIFDSIVFPENESQQAISIMRMNSLCITLGLPHRFHKENDREDIAAFMDYLDTDFYKNDFSLRVSQILLERLSEETGKNLRDFLERINIGLDTPDDVMFRRVEETEGYPHSKDLEDIAWCCIRTFGLVGGLYQIYLVIKILGIS